MNTYCINLKNRRSRWVKMLKEAAKLDIEPIRFEAIFNHNGHLGCMMSHMELLEEIEEDIFMIIEDDILVLGTREEMDAAIKQLPDDWDMLYLGAHLKSRIRRYSDNLFTLKDARCNHAIMYNNQHGVVDYILKNYYIPIDNFYAEKVQERFNCYITYPMICTQDVGFSDIIHAWKGYTAIEKNYKLYAR